MLNNYSMPLTEMLAKEIRMEVVTEKNQAIKDLYGVTSIELDETAARREFVAQYRRYHSSRLGCSTWKISDPNQSEVELALEILAERAERMNENTI